MKIAIDGPVGAGKTVVGRRLAGRLGYRFLDTGLMYRAVTLAAMERGTDFESDEALSKVAHALEFELRGGEISHRLLVDGEDVTDRLRQPEVEARVSRVSAVPEVRSALVNAQREMADNGGMVMVGRDIGTVVLPSADLKVFLDASQETRAKRRTDETPGAEYALVLESLIRRDRLDSDRVTSPLRAAEDSEVIDTDGMTIEQVVERIMSLAHSRKAG